jgi:hypothetical protein
MNKMLLLLKNILMFQVHLDVLLIYIYVITKLVLRYLLVNDAELQISYFSVMQLLVEYSLQTLIVGIA